MSNLKKNLMYNTLYQILIIILPLILSPYVSRKLGATNLGVYSYTYSIANYYVLFASLGISTYGNRTIAQSKSNRKLLSKTFINVYSSQIITSIIAVGVYIIYIFCYCSEYKLISMIQLLFVISNLFDVTWFFFGIEDFKITVLRNTIVKVCTFILIILLVNSKNDLWKYTLIMSLGSFIGQVSIWPILLKKIDIVKPELKQVIYHAKKNTFLFIPVLAMSIFTIMDKIMLGSLSNIENVGYYENTEKVINIPKAVIRALGTVMMPRISTLLAEGKNDESEKYLSKTMMYVMLVSSAMVFGLMAVGPNFAVLYWGKEFEICGYLIVLMAPALVFSVLGNVIRTQYLIPQKMDKPYTVSLAIGAIVNMTVNIILIPIMGALGAVIGTLLAEFSLMFYQFWVVRKKIPILYYLKNGIPFYICGVFMYLCIFNMDKIISNQGLLLLAQFVLGGVVFLSCLGIYLSITKNKESQELRVEFIKFRKKCLSFMNSKSLN